MLCIGGAVPTMELLLNTSVCVADQMMLLSRELQS